MTSTGNFNLAVNGFRESGRRAFYAMKKSSNVNVPIRIWLKIFQPIIEPILLYGSEVWDPLVNQGFENRHGEKSPQPADPEAQRRADTDTPGCPERTCCVSAVHTERQRQSNTSCYTVEHMKTFEQSSSHKFTANAKILTHSRQKCNMYLEQTVSVCSQQRGTLVPVTA